MPSVLEGGTASSKIFVTDRYMLLAEDETFLFGSVQTFANVQ